MLTKRATILLAGVLAAGALHADSGQSKRIRVLRVPHSGIQPQVALDPNGVVHLVYFSGEARHGDLYYARSTNGGATFSPALRVNSQPGSAIAIGTIRGAHLAVGRSSRVHVAWNGSDLTSSEGPLNPESGQRGAPMLYTRMTDAGDAFEPQRGLMRRTFGLDGGGSVAADSRGNVYVAWHGKGAGAAKGEAGRQVWVTRSDDEGRTFRAESPAWDEPTGACGCCGLRLFAEPEGAVYGLYRSATSDVHRDIYLLVSTGQRQSFRGSLAHRWEINACPMSSMALAQGRSGVIAGWETDGQIYFSGATRGGGLGEQPRAVPGAGAGRKHPSIAVNGKGETIVVWTEGTGWQRGGSLAWQFYDSKGEPVEERGNLPGVPVWSFAAVFAKSDGEFVILY
ncbi:MAG: hypothetical protein HY013_10300 [Candidatus Solibacter usitatus]|nr:hypothetical protein [Candidatus Solibacter usitatus]